MTGVDILAMEEVAVEWAFNWHAFWITFAIVVIGGLAFSVYKVVVCGYSCTLIPTLAVFSMIAGFCFGALMGRGAELPTKHEVQYKVTVSDEVPMTEFLEKYEIIDADGKIFIVREKGE